MSNCSPSLPFPKPKPSLKGFPMTNTHVETVLTRNTRWTINHAAKAAYRSPRTAGDYQHPSMDEFGSEPIRFASVGTQPRLGGGARLVLTGVNGNPDATIFSSAIVVGRGVEVG
jgi:hypothetical protein